MSMSKYGVPTATSGVYIITNLINGYRFIGSSGDVAIRLSRIFNCELKTHPDRPLMQDILLYGIENFECMMLEVCGKRNYWEEPDKEVLLERERFYVELMKPEYNQENQNKATRGKKTRAVIMMDMEGVELIDFDSVQQAGRWLRENTEWKQAGVGAIVHTCNGQRKKAYNYKWRWRN